jgi:hypothetical protein
MSPRLPARIRRIVLLSLATSLLACGGTAATSGDGGSCNPAAFTPPPGDETCAPRWKDGDGCNGGQVLFPCGLPPAPNTSGPSPTSNVLCAEYCMGSPDFNSCIAQAPDGGYLGPAFTEADAGSGPIVVSCYQDHTGRRPAGLVDDVAPDASSIGEVLARTAYLEAASIDAFIDLAVQLEAHGAPAELTHRMRLAAGDEVRHARGIGALARAHGAEPPRVRVVARGLRTLLALALENAREGCVRETWGAACAVVQSTRAADPAVRALMTGIAHDELRHAALSWDLAAWIDARLTADERTRVLDARASAVRELQVELDAELPTGWRSTLGLPTLEEARHILGSMRAEVWGVA